MKHRDYFVIADILREMRPMVPCHGTVELGEDVIQSYALTDYEKGKQQQWADMVGHFVARLRAQDSLFRSRNFTEYIVYQSDPDSLRAETEQVPFPDEEYIERLTKTLAYVVDWIRDNQKVVGPAANIRPVKQAMTLLEARHKQMEGSGDPSAPFSFFRMTH